MIRTLMISLAVLGLGASTSAIAQTAPVSPAEGSAYYPTGPDSWMIRGNAGDNIVTASFAVNVDGDRRTAPASQKLPNGDFYMQLAGLPCGTRVYYRAIGFTAEGKKVTGNRESFDTFKCGTNPDVVLAQLEAARILRRVVVAQQ